MNGSGTSGATPRCEQQQAPPVLNLAKVRFDRSTLLMQQPAAGGISIVLAAHCGTGISPHEWVTPQPYRLQDGQLWHKSAPHRTNTLPAPCPFAGFAKQ